MDDTKTAMALDKLREAVLSGSPLALSTLLADHRPAFSQHCQALRQGQQGFDPLYLALRYREEECAALLLQFGFPHNRDYEGSSVESLARELNCQRFSRAMELHRSGAGKQLEELVDAMLARSAEDRRESLHELAKQAIYENALSDRAGNTLLHVCATQQDLQALVTAYTLAVMGINVNTQNKAGETALHVAASRGHPEMCRTLLMCGVNPLLRDRLGQLATDCVAATLEPAVADEVAAIIARYSPGLAEALRRGSYKSGVRALDLWVNPHAQILPGMSALDFYRGGDGIKCEPLARALEREAAFLDLQHNILADNTEGVKLLLRKQPGGVGSLRLDRRHPETNAGPLSAAVRNRNAALVRALLQAGAPVRGQRPYGEPLANFAITSACQFDLLMELVESGVDSDARDPDGFTMLHRLIRTDIRPQHFAQLLLARGRQNLLLLKDRLPHACELRTPREMALRLGRQDLADAIDEIVDGLFRERSKAAKGLLMTLATNFYGGANFGPVRSEDKVKAQFLSRLELIEKSCNELFKAIRKGNLEQMKALNEVDYRDASGYTALIRAVACDRYDMALWILAERPQQAAMADNEGLTPLHYAYLLPESTGSRYVQLLTRTAPVPLPDAAKLEGLADMRGFAPCSLRERRDHRLFEKALERARTRDAYGRK